MMNLIYCKMLRLLVLYDGLDQGHHQGLHQVLGRDQGLPDKALKSGKNRVNILLIYYQFITNILEVELHPSFLYDKLLQLTIKIQLIK
jgi:hypothetical protein